MIYVVRALHINACSCITSDALTQRKVLPNSFGRSAETDQSSGVCRRTHSRKAQVFFHVSAVDAALAAGGSAADLSTLVKPGQPVEFEVQEADGRLQAVAVRLDV